MAEIVAGFASSHTPMMALPPERWVRQSERDYKRDELVDPQTGRVVTYEELLAGADPTIASKINLETFIEAAQPDQLRAGRVAEPIHTGRP